MPVSYVTDYATLNVLRILVKLWTHCNENPIYEFLFWGIALPQSQFSHLCVCERFIYSQNRSTYFPNFHIHVSVNDLFIPRIGPHIFLQQNRQIDHGNIWIAHTHMNVEIGTESAQFLFWEFLFQNFGIVFLQCMLLASKWILLESSLYFELDWDLEDSHLDHDLVFFEFNVGLTRT